MPRVARRHAVDRPNGGFHRCLNRAHGYPGEYPLDHPSVVADFIARLRDFVLRFRIHCAGSTLKCPEKDGTKPEK